MRYGVSDHKAQAYLHERATHWDHVAKLTDTGTGWGNTYQKLLSHYYLLQIPRQSSVLELGCGRGDLLASLEPAFGVGIDFSHPMIKRAAKGSANLLFIQADVHHIPIKHQFDFIIISDLVNDLWDVQQAFAFLHKLSHPGTRIIINTYSRLWQPLLQVTQKLSLSKPNLSQNWFTVGDLRNLLNLTDFEIIRSSKEIILPLNVPIITSFINKVLAKLWPFSHLSITNFVIARSRFSQGQAGATKNVRVSVIIPARNEAGNIENIFMRVPEMGKATELIFIEGGSSDNTYEEIESCIQRFQNRSAKVYKQVGIGKGDAVRLGFSHASGDILMILDADLTVPPEDLPRFLSAIVSGKAEFVNGVRLVYPMENQAMQFANLIGNKMFSVAFSWLLGQPIKDSLCGTKVLWRKDYFKIAANRAYFGEFDPFGDFDLLFGAAKLNLKIVDLPIRYQERTYGSTNISRWRHGVLLLRMVIFALFRVKFI